MTTIVDWQVVNGTNVTKAMQEASEKLGNSDDDVLFDFSAVQRIDPAGLRALEDFAAAADQIPVKIVLRGVNVSVYKVLKLSRLSARFMFAS